MDVVEKKTSIHFKKNESGTDSGSETIIGNKDFSAHSSKLNELREILELILTRFFFIYIP